MLTDAERSSKYREAARGAWVGIYGNALLGAAKLLGGIWGQSMALIAAAIETLSDSLSSIVVLWGVKRAGRPADTKHPFGHGKAEFMAARSVAVLLMIVAVLFGYRAVSKIVFGGREILPATWTLGFAMASVFVKFGMYVYKIRLGRRLGSQSVIVDAWHHLSDAFASICALGGIAAAIALGPPWRILDPIAALVICTILFGVGAHAFLRAGSALMDEAADPQTLEAIRRAAASVPGVRGTEKLISRRSGLETQAELHVEVDPATPVGRAHDVASEVSEAIRRQVPAVTHITVHIEPYYPDDH